MEESTDGLNRRQFGAISILLGNAALFAHGLIAHMHSDNPDLRKAGIGRMTSAALYSGTGLIIGRYGKTSVSDQLHRLEGKLAAFMRREGIPLDAAQIEKADAETRKGWFAKLEDFAYDHPMETANTYNAIAALGMFGSGLFRRRGGETTSGNANILNTLMIMAGTLVSVLVKERTPEQVVKKGDAGTLWGKVQEQPLNYAVWPFMGADISYVMQAKGEHKAAKALPRDHAFRSWALAMPAISIFVMASSLVGDVLTGFSSKKPGGAPKEREAAQAQLIDSAARIVAMQPPETQTMLAHKVAEYLATQQSLRMGDFDADALSAHILQAAGKAGKPPHREPVQPRV